MKLHCHRNILIIVLFVVMVVAIFTCKKTILSNSEVSMKKETKVGILFDSFAISRWKTEEKVFVDTIENSSNKNVFVSSKNASGDSATQLQQLNSFIEEQYNIIAIVPVDPIILEPAIKKAKDEGIIIISYDRLLMNCNCDLYLSFDNEYVGTLMAKSTDDLNIKNKKAIMLSGPKTDNNAALVNKGFVDYARTHKISILDKVAIENWKPEIAEKYIDEHKKVVENCNIIMCGNDAIAYSAKRSLVKNKIDKKIYVLGQDGDLTAFQNIVTDSQYMTVYKDVKQLAQKAAEIVLALASGGTLKEILTDKDAKTINDGVADVPYIKLYPVAIDKNNIDSKIIKSKIYSHDEVYMLLEP